MNNRIYVATFSDNAIEEIRKNKLNIELNHLCISENLDKENIHKTIREINEDLAASKAPRAIVHGPFTEICPASIDHLVVEVGLMRLNQAYEACRKIGVDSMVVHSGHMPLLYFDSWHLEKSLYFWKEFMKDKGDFKIYIENVFETEPVIMLNLIEELDDPRIKLCLDIGHANAVMNAGLTIFDWIETLGKHIGHFHIHNNDGKHDLHGELNTGTMDMKKVLEAIDKYCHKDVTMTIESRGCKESINWLKNKKIIE